MARTHRVDPRVRAYGKARIDVTRRAQSESEWQSLWREPRYPFPFTFGRDWKLCIQYLVEDFAAEIGFYIDVLGFPVGAFSPNYAQFTSPGGDFTFSVASVEGNSGTPPDSITLQLMVTDLPGTVQELVRRGVVFEKEPEAVGNIPNIAVLRSPHGVRLELWEAVHPQPVDLPAEQRAQNKTTVEPETADFWADFPDEEPEPAQIQTEADVTMAPSEEATEEDLDESLLDEPVYVDEEEDVPSELITARPPGIPPVTHPAISGKVIRSAEELKKSGLPLNGRKIKGNGLRGFPTLNDLSDRQDV